MFGWSGVISFYKVAAPMIGISGLGGIASNIFLWLQQRNIFICTFYSLWSVIVVIFTLWRLKLTKVTPQ